jgi:hypothetical protein
MGFRVAWKAREKPCLVGPFRDLDPGFGCRDWGFGLRASGLGYRVSGIDFRVWGSGRGVAVSGIP